MIEPTAAQIESYRRNGFLIVDTFLERTELGCVREHFMRVFAHEWETGLAPDDMVVVEGLQHAVPGETVDPSTVMLMDTSQ